MILFPSFPSGEGVKQSPPRRRPPLSSRNFYFALAELKCPRPPTPAGWDSDGEPGPPCGGGRGHFPPLLAAENSAMTVVCCRRRLFLSFPSSAWRVRSRKLNLESGGESWSEAALRGTRSQAALGNDRGQGCFVSLTSLPIRICFGWRGLPSRAWRDAFPSRAWERQKRRFSSLLSRGWIVPVGDSIPDRRAFPPTRLAVVFRFGGRRRRGGGG